MRKQFAIVLHNVRSAHNVGSIFRTADAAGAHELFLVGYTPAPRDRFGHTNKDIRKTALGAELTVPWIQIRTWKQCEKMLRVKGYVIVAVERDKRAVSYMKLEKKRNVAFIVGNEVRGLSKQVLDTADTIVDLPMRGKKESLNVAVAAGIVLYSF